ncbi:tetraspanin-9-like [Diospyros lotus]|uniref:tetraspanin-9-like n=1 Tax=Diospyros lotus TaxID=55363 RepID=UPI0022510B9C|nr:tetraspanin-9-like [Diospyros lotus]
MSDESQKPLLPVQSNDGKNPAEEVDGSNSKKNASMADIEKQAENSGQESGQPETSGNGTPWIPIDCSYLTVCIINIILLALLLWAYIPFLLSTECVWITGKIAILQGISIFILSALVVLSIFFCMIYSSTRRLLLLVLHVVAMALLIYLCCLAMSLISRGSGEKLPEKEYMEYRFEAYPDWVQGWVTNHWSNMKSCLKENGVCQRLEADGVTFTEEDFYIEQLSPIESGCCKPSNDCKFGYVSPTEWVATANSSYANSDCKRWSNNEEVMCFNCRSCKAGTLDNLRIGWVELLVSLIEIVTGSDST